VLEGYPDSGYADDALFGAVRSFKAFAEASIPAKRQERYQQAADAYQQLVQLFPNSPVRAEAEVVYAGVEQALGRFQAGR
jgi:outer membrane protein assembly factor BamD